MNAPLITSFCTTGGCAGKIGPDVLETMLSPMRQFPSVSQLLVGLMDQDDAAVYAHNGTEGLIFSADFIPPLLDDPTAYGEIAAAHAINDIYAMGGTPLMCVNLLAIPQPLLGSDTVTRILGGVTQKIMEAGAFLVGGHSIRSRDLLCGLAVIGLVNVEKMWRKNQSRVGDAIVLTKPLGAGVVLSAHVAGMLENDAEMDPSLACIRRLNRAATEALCPFHVHAATDVSGFGLVHHAADIARHSAVSLIFDWERIPILEGALNYMEKGVRSSLTETNRRHIHHEVRYPPSCSPTVQDMLNEPQTNGGLLVTLPWEEAGEAVRRLHGSGERDACVVGRVAPFENDFKIGFSSLINL
ncbi:MAG: selenide, water dikinase SelD [Nitrospirae bacterium]|nr:selenide, water dikinase SelD [Magnetococcales bacterium]HAT51191.1 selenide, water dikinase SelD [Alphaproteobacteria bacterium]